MGCFTPEQYQLCFDGLVEGFPARVDLANLLNEVAASPKLRPFPKAPIRKKLRNMSRITSETSDTEKMVYAIIQTIEAASLCSELVTAAHALNPLQEELTKLKSQFDGTQEASPNNPPEPSIDVNQLNERMQSSFDLNDIKALCFSLGIKKDSIAGDTIEVKIIELIEHMQRHGRLSELVAVCQKMRPRLNWKVEG